MSKSDLCSGGDHSRREFLGEFAVALTGALLPLPGRAATTATFQPDDIRRYGVVANSAAAASSNTAALAALVTPAGNFSGKLTFPNSSGKDVYHFNDMIPFHDGVHIDLLNSTLHFSKNGVARDTNAGFLHALRDFSVENGSIVVDYVHNGGFNTGNALSFGGRDGDCALFPKIFDSQLAAPMGNIAVRNIRISSNSGGGEGRAILALGGLDGILLENVTIDGQSQLLDAIYYEFGWATDDPKPYLRQTSHARNFQVKNLTVSNVQRVAFGATGAYTTVIDGIKVSRSGGVCAFSPGEATYFRMWTASGDHKSRPNVAIRDVVGELLSSVGITVIGASKISSGFLDNPPAHNNPNGLTADSETDLIDFTLEDFSMTGSPNNYGVLTSAGRALIRNGTVRGFQRGVVTTQECTKHLIEGVNVLDSTGLGMQIGQPVSLHNPARRSSSIIRRCVVAGSGATGSNVGIAVGTSQSCVIEDCRFGYDQAHDQRSERTQAQAVLVSVDAVGVVCRGNLVGATAANSAAYTLLGPASAARQCRLEHNTGVVAATGGWLTERQALTVQTIGNAGRIGVSLMRVAWVTAATAVTDVKVQPGLQHEQTLTVIHDGPAANSIAFGAAEDSAVANGTAPIAGGASRMLIWNGQTKLWSSFGD